MATKQISLSIEPRPETGKGAAGRARKAGRVPAVLYGYETEPAPVSVDDRELYHALHTEAGTNVLLTIEHGGETKLCIVRDIQRHLVRGDLWHVDLVAVDKNATIAVEIPIHLTDEPTDIEGVVNQVLSALPIQCPPLLVPNSIELSIAGMTIGDVKRAEELADKLPEGATLDVDPDRTIVTVNPPDVLAEPEEDEDLLGLEGEDPDAEGEEPEDGEAPAEDGGDDEG